MHRKLLIIYSVQVRRLAGAQNRGGVHPTEPRPHSQMAVPGATVPSPRRTIPGGRHGPVIRQAVRRHGQHPAQREDPRRPEVRRRRDCQVGHHQVELPEHDGQGAWNPLATFRSAGGRRRHVG